LRSAAGLFRGILKNLLTEPERLSALLDQMISIAAGTGFHAQVLALKFRKDIHANRFAVGFAGSHAVRLQYLHDVRLVWPSQKYRHAAVESNHHQLGNRIL
jgi:hypothetical protein